MIAFDDIYTAVAYEKTPRGEDVRLPDKMEAEGFPTCERRGIAVKSLYCGKGAFPSRCTPELPLF
jgi:hypothetical protein